jgi:hypothetical protein
MRYNHFMIFVGIAALGLGCDSKYMSAGGSSRMAVSGFEEIKDTVFDDTEYSGWMSKADQQVAYDARAEGTYFAHIEGRSNGGFHQYRHVLKPFQADQYDEWAVYWGLTTDEFYQIDLKMLRSGSIRQNMQVFVDAEGKAYHQAVWLKPKTK